ncbi:hypothetical protein [Phyllobacterium phragmitis]|nr:hypothetical protein [Phyllobacterium phragmitis]
MDAGSNSDRIFVISAMRVLDVLSLIGIALASATVFLLDPCAKLR